MSKLDELKIKYFNDMVKLEQDKQRIIKMEEKKGKDIRDFFGGPPKFNPYQKKKVVTRECMNCYIYNDTDKCPTCLGCGS